MIEGMEGFVGIGVDFVYYDFCYVNIIGSLFGNVIIVEMLEYVNKIVVCCQYCFCVVIFEGDVVNVGGFMIGGSQYKKNVSLFSWKWQLD